MWQYQSVALGFRLGNASAIQSQQHCGPAHLIFRPARTDHDRLRLAHPTSFRARCHGEDESTSNEYTGNPSRTRTIHAGMAPDTSRLGVAAGGQVKAQDAAGPQPDPHDDDASPPTMGECKLQRSAPSIFTKCKAFLHNRNRTKVNRGGGGEQCPHLRRLPHTRARCLALHHQQERGANEVRSDLNRYCCSCARD